MRRDAEEYNMKVENENSGGYTINYFFLSLPIIYPSPMKDLHTRDL